MKAIKPVQIPLDIVLKGLQNSKPKYIALGGVRVNLYEVASTLIESLLKQMDEAVVERQALVDVVDELLPGLCKLTDIALTASFCYGDAYPDSVAADDAPDADKHPTATVISTMVKHEMV